ncbi:MAG: cation:proton antiporter [Myxococcales bacterium]|nr:cation:proton antiporter [Myxococcales bacterium]
MTSFAILLVTAAIASGIATRVRLPAGPFLIVAGVALRASGLPLDGTRVREALVLSGTFLLFALGTVLDLSHPRHHIRSAIAIAMGQLVLLVAIGSTVGWLAGLPLREVLHVSLAVAASSSLVATEMLRRRQRVFEPVGRVVIGVLLVQDVIVISGIAVLGGLDGGAVGIARSAGSVVALGAGAYAFARWVAPYVMTRMGLDDEQELLVTLTMLFAFLGASHALELPAPVGAFFAGVAFSRFPVSGLVRAKVSSFSDFFVATFYVSLGAVLVLPTWQTLAVEGALVTTLVLLAPIFLLPIARWAGLTTRAALEAVTLLAQCGELALVVGVIGLARGDVSEHLFGVIATVAVVTMFLAPLISSDTSVGAIARKLPRLRPPPRPRELHDHVVWVGAGAATRPILRDIDRQVPVVVIDEDRDVVKELADQGIHAVRADGADPHVLRQANLPRARLVVSTLRREADVERLVRAAEGVPVWVRVFSPQQAERVSALGARPVIEAEVGLDHFLRWYEGSIADRSG